MISRLMNSCCMFHTTFTPCTAQCETENNKLIEACSILDLYRTWHKRSKIANDKLFLYERLHSILKENKTHTDIHSLKRSPLSLSHPEMTLWVVDTMSKSSH